MDLLFSSASLLGYNYEFEFIGDNYNFRNNKVFNIEGTLIKTGGVSGVSGIWSGVSGIINTQHDYKQIILNGVSFGSGRLESISFEDGIDVRTKKYSASIRCYDSGNISNINQSYYSGLYTGLIARDIRNIESISESFDFKSEKDGTYTYGRQLSFKLESGKNYAAASGLVSEAKNIALLFFRSDVTFPVLNSQYPSFYEQSGKRISNESYDLINAEYSFNETFIFQNSNNYKWIYSTTLNNDENGEVTVEENGTFNGVDVNAYSSTLSGFNSNFSGVYSRLSGIYSYYYGTGCSLYNTPIRRDIKRDIFAGEISYSVAYSNSPKYQNSCVWDRSVSIDNNGGNFIISEDGQILGLGNVTGRYSNARSCFSGLVLSGLNERFSGYYSGFKSGLDLSCNLTFNLLSKSITDSEYGASIEYGIQYSSDSRLQTGIFTFSELNYSNTYSTPLKSNVPILGDINSEYAIPVYRGNSNLGTFGFQLSLVPQSFSDLNTYVQSGKLRIDKSLIPSSEYFLSDASYSYDFSEKKFNMEAEYSYVLNRTLNNILI